MSELRRDTGDRWVNDADALRHAHEEKEECLIKGVYMANDLVEFYGRECPHCHKMDPLVARLEKEEKVEVEKLEVWHDEKNAGVFEQTDQGRCGGVPFFFNRKTKQFICGEADYVKLKNWATGK